MSVEWSLDTDVDFRDDENAARATILGVLLVQGRYSRLQSVQTRIECSCFASGSDWHSSHVPKSPSDFSENRL